MFVKKWETMYYPEGIIIFLLEMSETTFEFMSISKGKIF